MIRAIAENRAIVYGSNDWSARRFDPAIRSTSRPQAETQWSIWSIWSNVLTN